MRTLLALLVCASACLAQPRKVTSITYADGKKITVEEYADDTPRAVYSAPVAYSGLPVIYSVQPRFAFPIYQTAPTYSVPMSYAAPVQFYQLYTVDPPRRFRSTPVRDFLFGVR